MSDDEDRRVHEADRLARIETHLEHQNATLARIETQTTKTNGRVDELESDAAKTSVWIKLLAATGVVTIEETIRRLFTHP